ncbi:MAG: TIM barrel protein [Saccharofermentanales bacterium]|jgi:sugar phosphate isomerase/epimerase
MRISVAIAQDNASPSAFVVWRGFASSMQKAADLGFDGVELALRQKEDIDTAEVSRLLKEFGLEVSCISTGQVFADLGLSLTNPSAEIRKRTIAVLNGLVDIAADFSQMVNLGRVRGSVMPGQTREEAEKLFLDGYQEIVTYAGRQGVTIILEPVNRYEINFINNLDQGSELLDKLPSGQLIGLMPDVFHMNIEDDRIGDSFRRNKKYVKYIHLADSNRWAPGWGHLDFDEVFEALKDINYTGWTSVEILPFPDPDSAARQAITHLRPWLDRY